MPPDTSPGSRDARIRFRRAVTLMVMTLLLPGSAQMVAGNRRVGRIALRTWAGLWGTVLLTALLVWLWPGLAFWVASSTGILGVIRLLLIVLALGWAYLFIDAWRLGEPLELRRQHRLVIVGINGALCFSMAGALLFGAHLVNTQRDFVLTMFGDTIVRDAFDGRYNVLLLGGDAGDDRWGLRPDSITVASIDEDTGQTVLFGLPRNLRNFEFRKGSVMHEQYPDGYTCDDCYLNSLATWARDHEQLFDEYDDPGVEATIEAVEGITGLRINYFAMVNLAGFSRMVDAVGGVEINVRDRIPIGGIGAPITGYIEPGQRKLNGFETLWFARSRVSADDYSRMARQKCVMNAMLDQLSPTKVLRKFEAITKASSDLIKTDLPASELDTFAQLALKARDTPLRTVSFVPPMINTSDPDIEKIHAKVRSALEQTRDGAAKKSKPAGGPGKTRKAPATGTTTGGAVGSLAEGYAANDADDLDAVC